MLPADELLFGGVTDTEDAMALLNIIHDADEVFLAEATVRLREIQNVRDRKQKRFGALGTNLDLDLREYVKWKQTYPAAQRLLNLDAHAHFSKLDAIREKCEAFGLDGKLFSDAVDGEYGDSFEQKGIDHACEELSLQLIENVVRRMDLEAAGETHLTGRGKVIPESLINEIAMLMLECCAEESVPPPFSLCILLRVQLERIEFPIFISKETKAKDLAILLYASDSTLSTREVARSVGVSHTTVSRWKKEPRFQDKINASGKISNARRLLDKLALRRR